MPRRVIGFTLIEMLVVIAIIAVLAAIMFPVFSRVRESGRRTDCLSHLNQIGTAMKAYSTDYGDFIVNWCVTNPNPNMAPNPKDQPSGNVCTWDVSILTYLKGTSVLLTCRSNPTDGARTARAYAMTQYTQRARGNNFWGAFTSDIKNPSDTVLVFEKGSNLPGSWGDALGQNLYETHDGPLDVAYDGSDSMTNSSNSAIDTRMYHLGGKNLLFVDGHAKFCPAKSGAFVKMGTSVAVPGMVWTEADLP